MISLPLQDPVMIITVIILVVLLSPLILERFRIPGIAGLLIFGMLIGPHGINLIPESLELTLFSTMGLLYLMFLAGLEIDLIDFLENKGKSLVLGLLSFGFPLVLGYVTGYYLLNLDFLPSLLIGAMLSSHTLISYPIASKQGIITTTIVTVIIGGTIIADVLALISLQFISDYANGLFNIAGFVRMLINFTIFGVVVFLIIPGLAKLFFRFFDGDLIIQYLFILALLLVSATTAELLHIEPIIGAFFCGLVLNRYIIHDSPLYKRIEFIGNSLFIPVFLISVGLLVDLVFYFKNPANLIPLFLLILVALLSKWLPALGTQKLFKLKPIEGSLIFGMTSARAASAIAIILVGYKLELIDELMINHTVVLILVSSIFSSSYTQIFGKKVAENQFEKGPDKEKEVIVVPVSNPSNIPSLLRFASFIKDPKQDKTIYGISVLANVPTVQQHIERNKKVFKKCVDSLDSDHSYKLVTRIDSTITNGIARAFHELSATIMVLGWHEKTTPFDVLFGNTITHVLSKTNKMLWVVKSPSTKFNDSSTIHLIIPQNAQFELGFGAIIQKVSLLSKTLKDKIVLHTVETAAEHIEPELKKELKGYFKGTVIHEFHKNEIATLKVEKPDLLLIVSSRKNKMSYSRSYVRFTMGLIEAHPGQNSVFIYPEQL